MAMPWVGNGSGQVSVVVRETDDGSLNLVALDGEPMRGPGVGFVMESGFGQEADRVRGYLESSDGWSNGRSPFPAHRSDLVLQELGYVDAAACLRSSSAGERDHVPVWALHQRFGFELFAWTVRKPCEDDRDLGKIEPPWPDSNRYARPLRTRRIRAGARAVPVRPVARGRTRGRSTGRGRRLTR